MSKKVQTRHSKEDALDEREFELLLEGANSLEGNMGEEAYVAVLLTGRLGMRAGELAHMRSDWIDWRRRMIEIPRYQRCEKGKDGGICGQCEQQAQQMVEYNPEVTIEEARAEMWRAKTDAAARSIPFDFSPRVEIAVERFFQDSLRDRWPYSQTAINRRINKSAEAAKEISDDDIYPHALRATAASYHAGRGLDVLPLQALLGWSQASTAERYVQQSPRNTARQLHQIHSR